MQDAMETSEVLNFSSSQVLGRNNLLKGMCKIGSSGNDGIRGCDCWHINVFMLEENRCRNSGGASFGGPDSPASVMFRRCANDPTFGAVLGKTSALMGFVMHHGFHADGHKW
jgi:hypothetical protein